MTPKNKLFNGLPYNVIGFNDACRLIIDAAASEDIPGRNGFKIVVTPNVHHFFIYEHDEEFRSVYDNAFLSLLDGAPLVWLARKGNESSIIEKISGSDIFDHLIHSALSKKLRVMLVGGLPGAADHVVEKYSAHHSKDFIKALSPPRGFEKDEEKNRNTIKMINDFSPHLLMIGLGAPKQELWMHRHRHVIRSNIAIGIGASIDFSAGYSKRAPLWMQKSGLEWFYRFISEPRRLFKRYFITNTYFVISYIRHKMKAGFTT